MRCISLVCGVLVPTAVLAAEQRDSPELLQLVKTFEGDYDNYEQWENDVEHGANASMAHSHLHSIFKSVPLPAFGDHIFYVQQYLDGTPSSIYRQRLYSFADDDAPGSKRGDIVLEIFSFDDPSQFVDAQLDLSKLTKAGLAPGNGTSALPGCEVHISKSKDGIFRGKTGDKCVVIDHNTGTTIRIEDDNTFAPDAVSIHERGYDAKTGALIFGGATPDVLNRTRAAREFSGYVAVEHEDGSWLQMNVASIHDGGQIVPVVDDATNTSTPYSIELAYCVYPSGPDGKPFSVLKVGVHQANYTHDGLNVPPAYSWTQPDAESIGINLRYIQTGLNLIKK